MAKKFGELTNLTLALKDSLGNEASAVLSQSGSTNWSKILLFQREK